MDWLNLLVVKTLPAVPKAFIRRVSNRYIAGDKLTDAVRVVRELNQRGMMATLDILGEHITKPSEADATVAEYVEALAAIHREKLDSNISIKLTAFGLKLDYNGCLARTRQIVDYAKQLGNFVRIDMEDSSCTTDTVRIYTELRKSFDNVGVVIQAYMRRSIQDIQELLANNSAPVNARLCKGIYVEPRAIAYKNRELINKNFTYLLDTLFKGNAYVGIATHDERLVWDALRSIDHFNLTREQYEFQMLLGVDEELRDVIVAAGHRLRIYVPFGKHWYAYSIRRLQENPQIAGHVLRNFLGLRSSTE